MAFHIRHSEAESALRELARLTGESLTEAISKSLQMRLQAEREARRTPAVDRTQFLRDKYARRQPVILDPRPADEILGYGGDGMPQ